MQWIIDNWQSLLVALIAVDQILLGIFPQVPIFGSIKNILSGFVSKPPAQ